MYYHIPNQQNFGPAQIEQFSYGKSREYWLNILAEVLRTNYDIHSTYSYECLQNSAPTLAQCLKETLTNANPYIQVQQPQKIFTLLNLMESLIQRIQEPYAELFAQDLSEVISTLFRYLPVPQRNTLKTRYIRGWSEANYFNPAKISQVYTRCAEIANTEMLVQQLNEKTDKLKYFENANVELDLQIQALEISEKDQQSQIKSKEAELQNLQNDLEKAEKEIEKQKTLKTKWIRNTVNEFREKEIERLNSKIESLEAEIEKLLNEKVINESEIAEYTDKCIEVSQLKNKLKRQTVQLNKQKQFVKEIASLNAQVENLTSQNERFQENILEKDKKIYEQNQKIIELETEMHNLKEKVIPDFQVKLNEATESNNNVLIELENFQKKVPQLSTKIETQDLEISAHLEEIRQLNEQIVNLNFDANREKKSKNNMLIELSNFQEKVPQLSSKIETQSSEISAHLKEIRQLNEQIVNLNKVNEELNVKTARLEMEIVHVDAELGKQTRERESLIQTRYDKILTDLKNKIENQINEINKLQKEKDAELVRHKQEVNKLKNEISENKGTFDTYVDKLAKFQEESTKLDELNNQEVQRLKNLIEKLESKEIEGSDINKKLNETLEEKSKKNEHLNGQVQRLEGFAEQLKSKEEEIECLNEQVQRLEGFAEQLKDKEDEIKLLKESFENQRNIAFIANEEVEEGERELERKLQEIEICKSHIQTLESNVSNLEEKLNNFENENINNKNELKQKENLIIQYKNDIKQKKNLIIQYTKTNGGLNSKITEFESQLNFYKRKVDNIQKTISKSAATASSNSIALMEEVKVELKKKLVVDLEDSDGEEAAAKQNNSSTSRSGRGAKRPRKSNPA